MTLSQPVSTRWRSRRAPSPSSWLRFLSLDVVGAAGMRARRMRSPSWWWSQRGLLGGPLTAMGTVAQLDEQPVLVRGLGVPLLDTRRIQTAVLAGADSIVTAEHLGAVVKDRDPFI